MKAKAKHDVKVLMEDNRFSNFLKQIQKEMLIIKQKDILNPENIENYLMVS